MCNLDIELVKEKSKALKKSKIVRLILVHIVCLVLIFVYAFTIGCIPKKVLGIPCPACGVTHACIYLLQFNILKSIDSNPIALFIVAYFLLFVHWNTWFKGRHKKVEIIIMSIGFVIIISFWVLRLKGLF